MKNVFINNRHCEYCGSLGHKKTQCPKKPPNECLTERELEICENLSLVGQRYKDIGDKLGISEETVKRHAFNICNKMGVDGRIDIAIVYLTYKYEGQIANLKAEIERLKSEQKAIPETGTARGNIST